jgi:5-formyltetrahydrofolate cyclo-ligase
METWEDIRQWRKAQRAELLARRTAAPAQDRRRWSETITQSLVAGFPILQWMTVSCYWPINGEFDPRFAIREFRKHGARAALPVVVQKAAPLEFREWWPGVTVSRGVFGLPVPEGSRVLRPRAALIPPVGFDRQGFRLGYGGGYFDRTLAALVPQPLKIAVGFELSRIQTIHPQAHDVPMDFVVTEAGIHRVCAGGLERLADPRDAAEAAARIVLERDEANEGDGTAGAGEYASPACYAHELEKEMNRK